jgi:hypothetical protein
MLRAGKAHWITLSGIVGVLVLVGVILFGGDSPTSVANRFLVALARGDVDTLMDLSYFEGDRQSLRIQWDYATKVAGPYYRFTWRIVTEKIASEQSAAVKTQFERDYGPGSYPENIDIPLVKSDGRWKVDVRGLYRRMYPALPY